MGSINSAKAALQTWSGLPSLKSEALFPIPALNKKGITTVAESEKTDGFYAVNKAGQVFQFTSQTDNKPKLLNFNNHKIQSIHNTEIVK